MRIIADTTCHLSIEEAALDHVILVPNQVIIGDRCYRDYLEIDSETFISAIEKDFPSTSQPAVGEIMDAYSQCGTEPAIHITTGKGLSSAFDSASGVKKSMDAQNITVFDSQSVAGVNRYLVQLATRMSKSTDSIQRIVDAMLACLKETQSYVIPVDFGYLKRSGRLTPLAATVGGFLKLVPVMAQSADRQRIEKFSVARTLGSALNNIVDDLVKRGVDGRHKIYVAHALNMENVRLAIEHIKQRIQNADIEVLKLAPGMITHGGPGCLVIQYILKDESN
ncbi:MAG TPA: hypothetical protein DEO50_07980 [Erysipelotrichaceae bacterium]|nr:MAG: hypothetical protein A2Y19_01205 [Firmicutes bacterium GWE2_51_13]HBZ41805.1 hypothetical protein [Erysipelotrichaceae bacterium]